MRGSRWFFCDCFLCFCCFSPPFRLGLLDFAEHKSSLLLLLLLLRVLLGSQLSSSSPLSSAQLQLTPHYWRRRDPPVLLRCPQLSSLPSSVPAHTTLLATTGSPSVAQMPSSAAPAHTSLLARTGSPSVAQMPSAQLTSQRSSSSHFPIGDDMIPQCCSDALISLHFLSYFFSRLWRGDFRYTTIWAEVQEFQDQ